MTDHVFAAFLTAQYEEGMALAAASDLLGLQPHRRRGGHPDRYVARFSCKGLIRKGDGRVEDASDFHVGIWFPADYVRRVDSAQVLTWLHPPGIWHPNIRPPGICIGRIEAGAGLNELLFQLYEIISYQNWAAHDALNLPAAQWARNHQNLFPLDKRPLRRRMLELRVEGEQ